MIPWLITVSQALLPSETDGDLDIEKGGGSGVDDEPGGGGGGIVKSQILSKLEVTTMIFFEFFLHSVVFSQL